MPHATREPLISVTELASRLTSVIVLDVRFDVARPSWGREEYARGHIAGAQFADIHDDLASPATPTSGRHPLPEVATFADWLGAHGATVTTPIVAYDQGPGAFAARLWWLLRSIGHADVSVLDGGLAAWTRAGHPVTTEVRAPTKASYVPTSPVLTNWVTADEVQRAVAANASALVDARAADRFAGNNEAIDPIAGHVPGAINRPFSTNLHADGTFLPPETLREQWSTLLGTHAPSASIMMCGSGVTACHNLLSLAHAGLPGARLYAGSWSEWIRDPSRGVAK